MDSHGFSCNVFPLVTTAGLARASPMFGLHPTRKRLFHSLAINSVSLITDELALVSFAHSRLDSVHETNLGAYLRSN
jgi:hypothetical protein